MTVKQARPYAVFDIDGTLIRWQLFHALSDALAVKGLIPESAYEEVLTARKLWKTRHSPDAFSAYEASMVNLIETSLAGIDYAHYEQTCAEVVGRYLDQVYTFTRDLIKELHQKNYLLFAISGSPVEVVSLVSKHYGFDAYAGTIYESKFGKLTGGRQLIIGQGKVRAAQKLIASHNAVKDGSVGIGDTLGDYGMLKLVERPIAFNPSQELLDAARKNNWEIVIERKNVIYQLKYEHGEYVLDTPEAR